jgi:hypothetical protein
VLRDLLGEDHEYSDIVITNLGQKQKLSSEIHNKAPEKYVNFSKNDQLTFGSISSDSVQIV